MVHGLDHFEKTANDRAFKARVANAIGGQIDDVG